MYKHFLLCWFIESTLIPTVHQLHISVIFVVLLHQGAEAAVIFMFSLLTPFFFPFLPRTLQSSASAQPTTVRTLRFG